MLLTLGKTRGTDGSVASRLLDCHERIRRFCALGERLATGGPAEAARDAATQLHRYFSVALPLHVEDEEKSVRPRLERVDILQPALATMVREHAESAAVLQELLARWQEIVSEPVATRCQATESQAQWLTAHMREHLAAEEAHLIPALARLPATEQAAIVAEMQSRRQR